MDDILNPVQGHGRYEDALPLFGGLTIWKAAPLVADALYGGRPLLGLDRQALHAAELAFAHPADGRPMAFSAPLPGDLARAWATVLPD